MRLFIDIALFGVPFVLVIGTAVRGWWRDRGEPTALRSRIF